MDKTKIKVVILCGGLGSRLSEETKIIPKPMVKNWSNTNTNAHNKYLQKTGF